MEKEEFKGKKVLGCKFLYIKRTQNHEPAMMIYKPAVFERKLSEPEAFSPPPLACLG